MKKPAATRLGVTLGAAVLSISALGACAAPGSGADGADSFEFVYAAGDSETSPNVVPAKKFMDEVTKRTDGRVTFKTHFGGSLLPSTEVSKGVKDGRIDIGQLTSPYDPAGFPLYNVGYVPNPETNAVGATNALRRMYEENEPMKAEAERAGVKFILHTGSTNASSLVAKKPMTNLADLKGKKVRVIGSLAKGLAQGGANPMAIPVEETFDALERDVIDGLAGSNVASLVTYKTPDLAPLTYWLPTGHFSSSIGVIMSKKKWDSLPDDIQQVMNEVIDEHYASLVETTTKLEADSCDSILEMGAKVDHFPKSESERKQWVDQIGNSMFDDWRAGAVKAGVSEADAKAVEEDFKRISVEEAEKASDYTPGEESCIAKSQGGAQ